MSRIKITKEQKISFLNDRIERLNELSPLVYRLSYEDTGYYKLNFKHNSEAKQEFYVMDTKDLNRIYIYVDAIIQHYRYSEPY